MSDVHPARRRFLELFFASNRAALERSTRAVAALSLVLTGASCGDEASDPPPANSVMDNLPGEGTTNMTPEMEAVEPPMVQVPAMGDGEQMGDVPLETPPAMMPPEMQPDDMPAPTPMDLTEPVERPPVECAPLDNPGALDDGDINVNLATEFQRIRGFGGMNQPRWIADLTPEQVTLAFGDGPDQLGLSLLRVSVSQDAADFAGELPTAQRAVLLGARVLASPWTPPPALKTNNLAVGGELPPENYAAYADHLLSFRDFMASNGVPLEAISIQNEPDIAVTYDSCDWTPAQMADFLLEQGPRFGDTKVIAAESFNFNRQATDPLLNDAAVAAELDIVGGHIYGNGLFDYPLARQLGKEVWMTEHYTDSGPEPDRANMWPLAYDVATELHNSMLASFNAYVWWYIRRGYGLITDDGVISKRGHLMAQFSRFIRPGYVRVAASTPDAAGVGATAYKNGAGSVVLVVLNPGQTEQTVNLDIFGSCVTGFDRTTTSETKSSAADGSVTLDNGRVTVTLDPQSVTTFVSQPIASAAP